MESFKKYFFSFWSGLWSLLVGMKITGLHFIRPKVTEKYPENRETLKISDRFRGTLRLVYDQSGNHKCIACGICQQNCPNDTIRIVSKPVETAEGKTKKVLDKYSYDLGSCTFCQLCVVTCPHDALEFTNEFEHAVYTREKLVKELVHTQSSEEKQ